MRILLAVVVIVFSTVGLMLLFSFAVWCIQQSIIEVLRQREEIRKNAVEDLAAKAAQQYTTAMETFRVGFIAEFNKTGNSYVAQMQEVVKQAEDNLKAVVKQAADRAAGKSQVM